MQEVKDEDLFDFLISEANYPFLGWNFSHITANQRMVEAPLTWSYASKILMQLRKAQFLLDMGTGGGEFLASLQPLPKHTCATERYKPNIPLARQRLEPLGVQVYQVNEDSKLVFADKQFDFIINRHEYYSPKEVWRVLKPGCRFITQQVGEQNSQSFNQLLGTSKSSTFPHWNLAYAVDLEDAGFAIVEQREDFPVVRFFDVGALVYFLKAVPWPVPDFSVEKYFDALLQVHQHIQKVNYVDVHDQKFLIIAQKY